MAERESTLISRMAGGDEKAFEELYNANARKVFAYLRSRNIDEETAADILQNTFLAAWRGAGKFQGGAKPLTWLIGIARHKLVDEIRVRERTRAAPLETVTGGHDPTAENEERLTVRQAVQALGDGAQGAAASGLCAGNELCRGGRGAGSAGGHGQVKDVCIEKAAGRAAGGGGGHMNCETVSELLPELLSGALGREQGA